jgi:hypothetical protein
MAEAVDQTVSVASIDTEVDSDRIGLVDVGSGQWHLRGLGGSVASFFYGNPGDVPFVGDWDCDGVDTPGLYRQSDGFAYLRNENSQGVAQVRFFFGNPGDVPLAGDFDGDGCDSLSIYRPSEARFFIINELGSNDSGLGAADFDYVFGNPGDKPFVGDFDGDGTDTVGLHRESTGFVYFRNSHTQGNADAQFFFGDPGDRLVAGDWGNIDGTDSPAVFRPANATFYFRYSNSQGNADETLTFGSPTHIPVAGAWSELGQTLTDPNDSNGSGAGTAKDSQTTAGGVTSTVGVPPADEGGGPPPVALPMTEAPSVSDGFVADPGMAADPGPVSEVILRGDLVPLEAPVVVDGSFDPQHCPGGWYIVWWGYNCPKGPGLFSQASSWLAYEYLPYYVGQLVPTGCTGTLVWVNVVLTAAHCVLGSTSFAFIPDLYGLAGPGSRGNKGSFWTGNRILYHAEYLMGAGRSAMFDYAFVVLHPNSLGQHAGDVYGWTEVYNLGGAPELGNARPNFYQWNAERYLYGYPQEGWWAGFGTGPRRNANFNALPWWCASNEGQYFNFGDGFYSLGFGCQTNGGNSGGPIFQRIGGQLELVSVLSTGGYVFSCEYYGIVGCGTRDGRTTSGGLGKYTSYYMMNAWGPPLLDTAGPAYGYDDLWRVLFTTSIGGAVCTGPCPTR